MAIAPVPSHVLIELTCPHCRKKNSVTIVQDPVADYVGKSKVKCAYCGKSWDASLPRPIMAGPFPK
jgi:transcription elongation factor Elf1